ncbi:methyltransferase domain-containing protein [Streptomyces sp. NPDC003077]|uniref:class I SAM-dependent methyltransferase n=1 Tax=Streptomyces sp. NPDC003077 TaxID=3154443 RepID=UPI0033B140F7
MTPPDSLLHHREHVLPYYRRLESRLGFVLLLGRTRHFGWYEPGQSPWRFSAALRRMETVLARKLALPAGSKILDVGCGVGDVARTVARATGAEVTGVDCIPADISRARRRTARASGPARATRFLAADFHDLPFDDGFFDGLYAVESFCHSAHPEKALAEFSRVLKPGGRLVIFDPSRAPDSTLPPEDVTLLRTVAEKVGVPSTLPHGRLEELLRDAGFTVDSVTDATPHMLPMVRALAKLCRVPYALARSVGRGSALINAMFLVEAYRRQDLWRYGIHVATKGK